MFKFLTSDVLEKKEGEPGAARKKKEKKQVLDKSGSLHLIQIAPQDS